MVKVIWTVSALEDLESIGEFIGKDSPRYAEITVEELFESVDNIRKSTQSWSKSSGI
jgi:toxin ParE1/3/4